MGDSSLVGGDRAREYKYQKLLHGQVRFLDLYNSENANEPLKGSLRHEHLVRDEGPADAPQTYEALSYTWGSNEKVGSIGIEDESDGSNASTVIHLTASLYGALKQLRTRPTTKGIWTLWIDQICINQDDLDERNRQVPLMSTIYQNAQRVIVWLGEADDNSRLTLEDGGAWMIEQMQRLHPSVSDLRSLYDMDSSARRDLVGEYPIVFVSSLYWQAFSELFARPYFRRAWIVQEIVLGREVVVHCGEHTAKWEDLALISSLIGQTRISSKHAHDNVAIIDTMRRDLVFRGATSSFLDAMFSSYCYECTDPRDKIYGILGLVDQEDLEGLRVDYSVSVEDLYISVAQHLVENGSLEVLSCVVEAQTKAHTLPSWVPDWRAKTIVRQRIEPSRYLISDLSRGASPHQQKLHIFHEPRVLRVSGIKLCEIQELGPVLPEVEESHGFFDIWAQWRDMVEYSSHVNLRERGDSLARLRRALLATDDPQDEQSEEFRRDSVRFDSWRYWAMPEFRKTIEIPKSLDKLSNLTPSLVAQLSRSFTSEVRARCTGRRLMLTVKGYIVMGPAQSRKGDLVVWLEGGLVPFVLREQELCWATMKDGVSQSRTWELVGACYAQGFMDGPPSSTHKSATQEFCLV